MKQRQIEAIKRGNKTPECASPVMKNFSEREQGTSREHAAKATDQRLVIELGHEKGGQADAASGR